MAFWQNKPNLTTPISATNLNNLAGGWTKISETLTFGSADAPTFVINTSADTTGYLSVGMKIKLTQTTVKYFIITAITSTTITVYGGTDYTLANATITDAFFSVHRTPFGFPMNTDKWTVLLTNTSDVAQTAAVANTWYNLGSLNVDIPIGLWKVKTVFYGQSGIGSDTPGNRYFQSALSTSNNSVSNSMLQGGMAGYGAFIRTMMTKENIINLTSKTRHYCIARALSTSGGLNIYFVGTEVTTEVRAVCAYL